MPLPRYLLYWLTKDTKSLFAISRPTWEIYKTRRCQPPAMSAANAADDREKIQAIFERHPDPVLTTSEVGAALDVSRRTALRKLKTLEDAGTLTRKEVGPRGSVWWLVDVESEPEYLKGFGSAEGTDYREAVAEVREELDEELEERTDAVF